MKHSYTWRHRNMEQNKLNIGSGAWPFVDYINIDDGSDNHGEEQMKQLTISEEGEPDSILFMDGNDLSLFDDGYFDEIWSNQCVGSYVTNFDEIIRVLKPGGVIKLGVWGTKVMFVVEELMKRGLYNVTMSPMNGGIEDGIENYTLMIEAINP